jgi:hypothetical protein
MKLFNMRGSRIALALAGVVVLGAVGLSAWAQAGDQDWANRLTLGRNVVKLAVVVMANQTPISQADAQAVLPALQAIRNTDKITEMNAATLSSKLLHALPAGLGAAVETVRLPEPRPEVRQLALRRAGEMNLQNPAAHGPSALAFGRLVQFFSDVAAGKQPD